MTHRPADRRRFLFRGAQACALLLLAGCDRLSRSEWFTRLLSTAERATYRVQRTVTPRRARAREFAASDVSPVFPTNGTTNPNDRAYQATAAKAFADWGLVIDGLVQRPARPSLSDLRALPSRTQIARHDGVDGWSATAKWKGARLHAVLDRAGRRPAARYVVDSLAGIGRGHGRYWEDHGYEWYVGI